MQKLKVPRYIQWIVLTGLCFLGLMTILRLVLVFSFPSSLNLPKLIPALLLGLRFDLRIVSIAAIIIFLIGTIPVFHPFQKKAGRAISFALWTIFIVVLCLFYSIDFPHYAYLGQRLNGSVLNYLDDAKISMKMVWQTYSVIWILFGLLCMFLLLVWMITSIYNAVLSHKIISTTKSRIAYGIIFFLLLTVGIFGRIGQFPLRWSDAFTLNDDYKAQVALNPFQSFFSSLSYRRSTYDLKKVKAVYPWMIAHLQVQKPDINALTFHRLTLSNYGNKPPQNVVLVICESFSAYKSSMVNNPLNTTPFFNEMVQQGVYFDYCFSPSYGTARGVWAILTGIPDVQMYKTASRNPAAVDQHIIINEFQGYEKMYFLGGSASWANIRGLLTNNINGLRLYEEGDYKAAKIDVWGISDKNLFLEANKVLATQRKPFFAIIQTADNHRPYTIPAEDEKLFTKQQIPKDTLLKYGFTDADEYNAFRYTDFGFRQFMQAAKKEPYFQNTLFVFVGDHGIRGDASNMLPAVFTSQGLTAEHIPLLFYKPNSLPAARYSFPASQLDVLPTIAGLSNITFTNTTLGKDLLKNNTGKNAFLVDVDGRRIGMIDNNIFFSSDFAGKNMQFSSIRDNGKPALSDSAKQALQYATNAYYETSRYLLLNNKKRHSIVEK